LNTLWWLVVLVAVRLVVHLRAVVAVAQEVTKLLQAYRLQTAHP